MRRVERVEKVCYKVRPFQRLRERLLEQGLWTLQPPLRTPVAQHLQHERPLTVTEDEVQLTPSEELPHKREKLHRIARKEELKSLPRNVPELQYEEVKRELLPQQQGHLLRQNAPNQDILRVKPQVY